MTICTELPEIQIVRHARAKHLRLRVHADSIRLTVPSFCSNKQIESFIQQSETWLLETWQKQHTILQSQNHSLPSQIQLFNQEQAIQIQYIVQKKPLIYHPEQALLLINQQQPESVLKAFVQYYAKHQLPEYLSELSQQCTLPFAKCNIRQPKTRWGSCSSKHDIMLNAALVLYPLAVVRYVCVHELVHTQHFDHSAAFWAEVAKYDPQFKQHRQILKTTALPYWWHR